MAAESRRRMAGVDFVSEFGGGVRGGYRLATAFRTEHSIARPMLARGCEEGRIGIPGMTEFAVSKSSLSVSAIPP